MASRRLLEAAAAARLIEIAMSQTTEPKDAIVAIREILDRAGIQPPRTDAAAASDGTVLREEFLQIHKRVVRDRRAVGAANRDAEARF